MHIFIHAFSDFTCFRRCQLAWLIASLWRGRVNKDGYRDQIVTSCLCFPRHIHCSCSTAMALLCTPVSELVSCTFSTISICPFLIQRITCNNVHYCYILQIRDLLTKESKLTIAPNVLVHSFTERRAQPIQMMCLHC